MRILHDEPFTDEEKKQKIEEIKKNIKDSMCIILQAMDTIDPPCKTSTEEAEQKRQWLLERYNSQDFEYTQEFFDVVQVRCTCTGLWKDPFIGDDFDDDGDDDDDDDDNGGDMMMMMVVTVMLTMTEMLMLTMTKMLMLTMTEMLMLTMSTEMLMLTMTEMLMLTRTEMLMLTRTAFT